MMLRFRLDKTARAGTRVTKRNCNIACVWCHHDYFQHGGFIAIDNNQFISAVDKVIHVAKADEADIRIAGDGEPTLVGENELFDLIVGLRKIPKVNKIKLTTNGILLGRMAQTLIKANLDGVSVSLNSLDRERYKKYSGSDELPTVQDSISEAFRAGLKLKINAIYSKFNRDEIGDYENLSIKFGNMPIKFFDLLVQAEGDREYYLPINELNDRLTRVAETIKVESLPYPKTTYRLESGAIFEVVVAGDINDCINYFCAVREQCVEGCRRSIRIGLDGVMRPCGVRNDNYVDLFDAKTTPRDILEALKSGGKINNN
jgi:GTP 3',8-cyclase